MTGNGVTSALLLERANGATELWTWGSSLYALAHAAQFPRVSAGLLPADGNQVDGPNGLLHGRKKLRLLLEKCLGLKAKGLLTLRWVGAMGLP